MFYTSWIFAGITCISVKGNFDLGTAKVYELGICNCVTSVVMNMAANMKVSVTFFHRIPKKSVT